jgi:hypothetical protein
VSHRAKPVEAFFSRFVCPKCHSKIEWVEQIVDQMKRDLRPGDNFVCAECAAVAVVTPDKRLRLMTDDEFQARRAASQKIIREAQTEIRSRLASRT